mgnify:CR=1 FL=1
MRRLIQTTSKLSVIALAVTSLLPLHGDAMAKVGAAQESLELGFDDPAMEYGPRTWWHWINERVSKDGITKDLEAMKEIGYKGVHMVNLPQGGAAWTVGDDVVGSDIWYEKVDFAAQECERLGMEFSFGSCPGWVAGGPWISPEQSMQDIYWRHKYVTGPTKGPIQLPQPNKTRGWYSDIRVLAYPSLPGEAEPLASLVKSVRSEEFTGVDWSAAIDGDGESYVELPGAKHGDSPRSVIFEFAEPETVRSLTVEMHEDSASRTFKIYGSEDGKSWRHLGHFHRWIMHFDPRREELVQGFPDATVKFVKIEFPIASPNPSVPMKLYELNFQSARLNNIFTKSARMRTHPTISDPSTQKVPNDQLIEADQILDLSEYLQADGSLNYELPAGDWTILRFGHTTNGNLIHPASKRSEGLEVDKFSKEALYHHLDSGVTKNILERMGELTGSTVVEMNIDSWEANCQTWTAKFPEEFEARRGYDMSKWLLALTGRFVGSVDETERFLWDYRRTIGDLLADNFYGAFADYVHEWGVRLSAEAPGIGMPVQCDQIQVQGKMDIPQGEFWLGGEPNEKFPQWRGGQDNTKEAAVAGHVYGKEVISCEAFTSFAHHDGFTQYPEILKPVGDRQFCKGMNEIVFHRYVHQPDEKVPGVGLGQFGLNLERTTTWWEPGQAWITYLRRCQYMLRQGRFFADACYYYGQDVPGSAWFFSPGVLDGRKRMLPVLPKGYDYDVCDHTTFATMFVEDGFVALPSGMRYQYLVLPAHARYTPRALEKVVELVEAGATVIGPRPSRSPTLAGFPESDTRIQALAAKLWPETAGPGERLVGKGRVITGKSFETILAEDALVQDFQSGDADVRYIHRKLDDGELYFVASQEEQATDVTLSFRVTGKVPEIWDAVTGEKTVASVFVDDGSITTIPMQIDSYGSRFVVFLKSSDQINPAVTVTKDGTPAFLDNDDGAYTVWENGKYGATLKDGQDPQVVINDLPAPVTVPQGWNVTFQEERGAPEGSFAFDQLISWTDHSEFGIKYFSGSADYTKTIEVPAERLSKGRRVWLDLGQVNDLAEVSVNGQSLGVLWKAPFLIDITDSVVVGSNQVLVTVTNCWKNRILGDWKVPADDKITWTLHPFYHKDKDADLMESGLLGPVQLKSSTTLKF